MTPGTNYVPLGVTIAGVHRFTVDEYHRMFEIGVLREDERIELIEGCVVMKFNHTPPHACTVGLVHAALRAHLPDGWFVRVSGSLVLDDSEPEPDLLITRGSPRSYFARH